MRPKMIYLVGAPATGKSSVMKEIHRQLGVYTDDKWFKIWPTTHDEFRGELLLDDLLGTPRGLSLGITREKFGGTDAIGMASSSEAMAWIQETIEIPKLILGEGSRLTIGKFFAACAQRVDLTIGHLHANQQTLDNRCEVRGSTQTATFRKAGATRAANAAKAAEMAGAKVIECSTHYLQPDSIAYQIIRFAGIK